METTSPELDSCNQSIARMYLRNLYLLLVMNNKLPCSCSFILCTWYTGTPAPFPTRETAWGGFSGVQTLCREHFPGLVWVSEDGDPEIPSFDTYALVPDAVYRNLADRVIQELWVSL